MTEGNPFRGNPTNYICSKSWVSLLSTQRYEKNVGFCIFSLTLSIEFPINLIGAESLSSEKCYLGEHQLKFELSQQINRPREEVFTIVSSFDYYLQRIDPEVIGITRTSDGSIGVGTIWHEELKVIFGITIKVVIKCISFDPPRSFSVSWTGPKMSGSTSFEVIPSVEGTDVNMSALVDFYGLGRFLYPIMRIDFPRREARRLSHLKQLIESGVLTVEGARSLQSRRSFPKTRIH